MATINGQDFQNIKIQLRVLGLTEIKYTKTVQGGMALFWFLTDKGEKLMLQLRSVKNSKTDKILGYYGILATFIIGQLKFSVKILETRNFNMNIFKSVQNK